MRFLGFVTVFLVIAAWQERENKLMFSTAITGLFLCAAFFAMESRQPNWIIISLVVAWAVSGLVTLWLAVSKVLYFLRRKMKHS